MRNVKKRFNYQQEEMDREEERYENEVKEANEERKNETEVLNKIELITGGRYRPVGESIMAFIHSYLIHV